MALRTADKTPLDTSTLALSTPPLRPLPRRPLPALVIVFMAGIVAGVHIPVQPLYLLAAALLCTVWALGFVNSRLAGIGLHAAAMMAGWAMMVLHTAELSPSDIRNLVKRDREYLDVSGRVVSQPYVSVADARGRWSWRFDLEVEATRRGVRMEPAMGRIRVNLTGVEADRHPVYGDRWNIKGVFSTDRRSLVRAQGLAGFLSGQMDYAKHVETGAGNSFVNLCYRMRHAAYERLGYGLANSTTAAALPRALLLGYRQDVPRNVYDAFARTGTLHILALSGMHVGILILLLVVVLKACGISRPYWAWFFIPFLVIYTVGTGAAASTVRASIMAIVLFSAFMFRRKPDTPTSLALAALLIVAFDPLQLFSHGFILSFVVVWGIIAIYPVIRSWMKEKTDGDPWADPEMSWLVSSHPTWRKLLDMLGISTAAWLASLPLIANLFHVISPVALGVNLVLVPLAFVILLTACLSLATGVVFPVMGVVFNHANGVFAEWLMLLVDWSSRIPGSHVYVPAWPMVWVLIWYASLAIWLMFRGRIRLAATVCLITLMGLSISQRVWSQKVVAVVMPVGDSNVLLVDGPGRHALLIDTGSSFHHRALLEQLRKRGISRIQQVWISRATTDAYGGMDGLLQAVHVEQIVLPHVPPGQRRFHEAEAAWNVVVGAEHIRRWSDVAIQEGPGDLAWRIVYPDKPSTYLNARQSALMLHVSRGPHSLLFMSQADSRLESMAASIPHDYNADFLIVGRCNNLDALTEQWLSLVRPKTLVMTTRAFDRLPFGGESLMRRLKKKADMDVLTSDLREGIRIPL